LKRDNVTSLYLQGFPAILKRDTDGTCHVLKSPFQSIKTGFVTLARFERVGIGQKYPGSPPGSSNRQGVGIIPTPVHPHAFISRGKRSAAYLPAGQPQYTCQPHSTPKGGGDPQGSRPQSAVCVSVVHTADLGHMSRQGIQRVGYYITK